MPTISFLRLRVIRGPNAGASLDCQQPLLQIGSDPLQNDLVLLDPQVLPQHLQIHADAAGHLVVTLAQGASARIHGASLQSGQPQVLPDTAVLLLGQTELLLECRQVQQVQQAQPHAPVAPPEPVLQAAPPMRQRRGHTPWRWPKHRALLTLGGVLVAGALGFGVWRMEVASAGGGPPSLASAGSAPDGLFLYETTAPASAASQASAPQPLELAGIVSTKDGPRVLQTTSGKQYILSTDAQPGWELFLAAHNRIVLHQGQEVAEILVE